MTAQTHGCHAGTGLSAGTFVRLVSGVGVDPSECMTQTFIVRLVFSASEPSNAREEAKAILLPSLDQTGNSPVPAPTAVSLVNGDAPDPSAFTTHTLFAAFARSVPFKARSEIKSSLLLSGDQIPPSALAPNAVRRVIGVAPEPSLFITQMLFVKFRLAASLPSKARFDINDNRVPSGDQSGLDATTPDAVIFVNCTTADPSAFITNAF